MLFYLGRCLQNFFGPARLLQSYVVLIELAVYSGFFITFKLLPKFYDILPHDRGREFTLSAEAAKGKPTGAGAVFITIYVFLCIIFIPMGSLQYAVLSLTWLTMLTGFLDDRSVKSWGEYFKGALDLIISAGAAFFIFYFMKNPDGKIIFWFPFVSQIHEINPLIFILTGTVLIWTSINTTNCTDGVDGLSGTLVLTALITLAVIFYFILGHKAVASYLLVPHLADGAKWAVMLFILSGILMGYLWHNAYPSSVMMGDAGSRALGFAIGTGVLITRNPLLFFATSTIIFINGGLGLLKVALLRFFKIKIFENIRFPLHDHMRKNYGWTPTQVLVKFLIMQILVTAAVSVLFFKVR